MFRPNFATIVSVLKQANNGRFVVHLYILIIKIITLLVKKKNSVTIINKTNFPFC